MKDCALLPYVLMRLEHHASRSGASPEGASDPLSLLTSCGHEMLSSIVKDGMRASAIHSLNTAQQFQIDRFAETLIVASATAALCRAHKLDPDIGFSRAVLGEAGLNLIAWNYPSLYESAIDSLSFSHSLDEVLSRKLGFRPDHLLTELSATVPSSEESPASTYAGAQWNLYDEFCQIGRYLGRAEFPETYPTAKDDWREASGRLEDALGSEFPVILRRRLLAASKGYYRILPNAFERLRIFNPGRHYSGRKIRRVFKNPFLVHCEEPIQDVLTDLYAEMPDDKPDRKILNQLLKTVIPCAGFTGGCLFLVNPRTGQLTPRTLIGKVQTLEVKPVPVERGGLPQTPTPPTSTGIDQPSNSLNGIATAFASKVPIVEKIVDADSKQGVARFCSVVGERLPIGVLFLERPISVNRSQENVALQTFRAINHTLGDALLLD